MNEFYDRFDFQSNFLLNGLSKEEMDKVSDYFEPINFQKGAKLFYEDGVPTGAFFIVNGSAKKYKTVIDGQEQIFYIYTTGDLLGYHALLSEERYQDSCEALGNLETQFISKDNFLKLMEELPKLTMLIIRNMAHEFGVLANTIAVLAQKAQNIRLAIFLLVLDNRFQKSEDAGINLSRQDLANLIGATRESLGRTLKDFKEDNLIEIKKKEIFIVDKKRLFDLING